MRTILALSLIALATAAACATPDLGDPDPPISDAPPSKHAAGMVSPASPLPSASGSSSPLPPASSSSGTSSASGSGSGSGGAPPSGAGVDAGAQAQRWKGTAATTLPVDFGGGAECHYRITLKQITVDVTAAADGEIVAANVTALAVEQVLSTPCNNTAIPQHTHYYSLITATLLPSGISHLELAGPSTNHPAASLVIEGDFRAADPALSLQWHRTDYGPPLDWTVNAQVTVKLQ
jgi:hypothetical protein